MNFSGETTLVIYLMRDDEEIEVTVKGAAYYQQGRYSGPPELCYPDESDVDIYETVGPDGKHIDLTDEEMARCEGLIMDKVSSQDYDDYGRDLEDYDDFRDGEICF